MQQGNALVRLCSDIRLKFEPHAFQAFRAVSVVDRPPREVEFAISCNSQPQPNAGAASEALRPSKGFGANFDRSRLSRINSAGMPGT